MANAGIRSVQREVFNMPVLPSVLEAIGNTPLIRLKAVSEATGCNILGKAEFLNPGQSVKDRAALWIIRQAEKSGQLRPGGVIVEGTAGNTGIGLAVVGSALGYRTVIVIPETQSQEKKDALRLLGAELVEVPAVPYRNPNNYVKISGRLAAQLAETEPNGAIWANQFDNVANRQAHVDTTAPEIWRDTDGKVDGFICAVGSGGTLAGVAEGLRARNAAIKIGIADPEGPHSTIFMPMASSSRAAARSPKASVKAESPPTSKTSRRTSPTRFRMLKRCPTSSISSKRKVFASAARPASTSPAPCGLHGTSGRDTRS